MMLTASPFHTQNLYAPTRPSPLSERHTNVLSRPFTFTMAAQPEKTQPAPQRAYKPNPVIQTRDGAAQRRRDLFFRRVQRDRDDRKWEARGDQIQRLDFITEQKRWEAAKAQQAPELHDDVVDEDVEELPVAQSSYYTSQPEAEMSEAEWVAAQEEVELQELIASMEEDQEHDAASQHYGSDDDDYDQIFMDCANASEAQQQHHSSANMEDPDAMDMS